MQKVIRIWKTSLFRIIIACFGTHTTSLMVGLCQGYSAILIPQLMVDSNMVIDSESASWIASLGVISNPIGAIVGGLLSEWFGRKRTVQMSSIPYFMGWLIISQSTDNYSLGIGRLITGLGVGMITTTFTYIAEITPANQRGILSAFGPVVTSFGVLLIYVMGYFFHWQLVALICVFLSTCVLIIMQIVPESPPWLIGKQRFVEAFNALKWLNVNDVQTAEKDFITLLMNCKFKNNQVDKVDILEQTIRRNQTTTTTTYCPNCVLDDLILQYSILNSNSNAGGSSCNSDSNSYNQLQRDGEMNSSFINTTTKHYQNECKQQQLEDNSNSNDLKDFNTNILTVMISPKTYKPFIILIIFFMFQEFTGIYIILFYSVSFLESIGINGNHLNDYIATIIVGTLRFVASIIGAILIQRCARKTLAIISGCGMCIFLMICAIYLKYYTNNNNNSIHSSSLLLQWLPLISILSAVMFSMFGFLQLPYVMNSELFPLQVRGLMSGIVLSIANIFIFISIKLYPNVLHYLTVSSVLILFGCTSLCGAIYCFLFLPETQNKTLTEIEAIFESKSKNYNHHHLKQQQPSSSLSSACRSSSSSCYVNQSYIHDHI